MRDLLAVARANRFAVPAFNISSSMLLTGAIQAAVEADAPVIIAIHPDELAFVGTAFVKFALGRGAQRPSAGCHSSRPRRIRDAGHGRHPRRLHIGDD